MDGETQLADESDAWNVEIHVKRQGRPKGTAASVYAPRFPKVTCLLTSSYLIHRSVWRSHTPSRGVAKSSFGQQKFLASHFA